jgi:hypothetical protein
MKVVLYNKTPRKSHKACATQHMPSPCIKATVYKKQKWGRTGARRCVSYQRYAPKDLCRSWRSLLMQVMEGLFNEHALEVIQGGAATLGMYENHRGTGKENCCSQNCGEGTTFKGWPLMFDQDAVSPPQPEGSMLRDGTKVAGKYVAGCPIPTDGIPKGAHMLRLTPCGAESMNQGVICALIKISIGSGKGQGQGRLVSGWGEVVSASRDPPECALYRKRAKAFYGSTWRKQACAGQISTCCNDQMIQRFAAMNIT